ncbi:metalloregulator ArsR/SmtB family transcription factor [Microtetraspora sp. NBRC 13810]|uniref:ArsR/SmtB family transcription factor n=1 Tax=Microtetraspora sp. NBRC 13810 TaxID=3030990 RepID=UPI0025553264|nr:metalloregulator ArsR/SmtB family transcription factor [Microtetraspora sp. NBRC 13810]
MDMLKVLDCCTPLAREPLGEEKSTTLARVFKALGDPVRLRIVSIVASHQGGEACVCDLTASFDLAQPTISHHLKVLKDVGLLTSERRASWVYYRIVPERLAELSALLAAPVEVGK